MTSNPSRKAVFLDRDGVLVIPEFANGRSYAPRSLDRFKFYPEARDCLDQLKAWGYFLVVVTNQPDVGTGHLSLATLNEMHKRMTAELQIDHINVCTHTSQDACDCRKPRPGMLVQAAEQYGINCQDSFMVGDRRSDILAGAAVGCKTIFIDHGYTVEAVPDDADKIVITLSEVVSWIGQRELL